MIFIIIYKINNHIKPEMHSVVIKYPIVNNKLI